MVVAAGVIFAIFFLAVCVPLSLHDLSKIFQHLKPFSYKWEEIGQGLGFVSHELENIKAMRTLLNSAPSSYLDKMLSMWQQWAPRDARGSSNYATLEALVSAMDRAGLSKAAQELFGMASTLSSCQTHPHSP